MPVYKHDIDWNFTTPPDLLGGVKGQIWFLIEGLGPNPWVDLRGAVKIQLFDNMVMCISNWTESDMQQHGNKYFATSPPPPPPPPQP